jgi:aryl-phospho-beta-D-glucosidase BglC (GH1 family)
MQQVHPLLPRLAAFCLAALPCAIVTGQPAQDGLPTGLTRPYDPALAPMRLHTEGTRTLDTNGRPVLLYGVNIASLEWRNDGDHVQQSVNRAINDWKVNLIRLPLAQDRWFGKMKDQRDGGAGYRAIVDNLVATCATARVYIDLDLHWSDCGQWVNEGGKLGQHNLADENSVIFWHDLATRFKNHPNVIFGLYNEPHDVSWEIWFKGGTAVDVPARRNLEQAKTTYEAVGMQKLYDTVRAAGAENIVTISGLDWGYDLSGVLQGHAIQGTNYLYETHPYPNKKDWDKCFGEVSGKYPVYVGEWGFGGRGFGNTNGLDYARNLMAYAGQHHLHWTAWDLHPSAGPTLIKNWKYEPTVFGQFVKAQLATAAAGRSSGQ